LLGKHFKNYPLFFLKARKRWKMEDGKWKMEDGMENVFLVFYMNIEID